jgi:hypothetical protein
MKKLGKLVSAISLSNLKKDKNHFSPISEHTCALLKLKVYPMRKYGV